MLKSVTVTIDSDVLQWARRKATDENTSVSKLIGCLLEKEMRGAYWQAYEEWKKLPDDFGASKPIDASKRMTREEAHERR